MAPDPPAIAVTTPVVLTVAAPGLLLTQSPPPVPSELKVVVVPAQSVFVPVIVPGLASGLTVTVKDVCMVPQPLVTL
jgi:hypothetical protein